MRISLPIRLILICRFCFAVAGPANAQGPCASMTVHVLGVSHDDLSDIRVEFWYESQFDDLDQMDDVEASEMIEPHYAGTTSGSGTFRKTYLDVGEYRIRVRHPERETKQVQLYCPSASDSVFAVFLDR